jgi:competence protein ComEA
MKNSTRRHFLRAASAAGLFGLAGCAQLRDAQGGVQDTDGDGVVDSEDYAPRDPEVQSEDQIKKIDPKETSPGTATGTADGTGTATTSGTSDRVDLNTASVDELTTLPGVGDQRAQAIVDYRDSREEPITDPFQLTEVAGISRELIEGWDGLVEPPLSETGAGTETGTDRVDLNTASVDELITLPGVGTQRAQAIVDYRDSREEPITDPFQLTEVQGITQELIASWEGLVEPPLSTTATATGTTTDRVDLNTAGESELTSLPGVGAQRAQAIIDYRDSREEPITDPYQLTEVQGITEDLIDGWEGLVEPPLPSDRNLVDLNTASESELTTLPGVGTQRAQAIISYRDSREEPITDPYQLTDVAGISRELIDGWEGLVEPPVSEDDRVNLNTAGEDELTTLPGVGTQRAQAIISYRESREEPITDPYQLTEVAGITEELIASWEGLVKPPLPE